MNNEIRGSLAWAGTIIGLSLAAAALLTLGYISDDTATRVVGINGLMIAWYGNRMPKALAPSNMARRIQRVGGWAFVLSGIVYTGVWAFAPIDAAVVVGCGAVLAGMAVTFAYGMSLRKKANAA
jgi:hypothetical protein